MRISRVSVSHYRSIDQVEIRPTGICALVGENNAGKTNILRALSFLLGETWPTKRGLDKADYHYEDTSEPIHIALEFEDNQDRIEAVWCTIPWGEEKAATMCQVAGREHYLTNEIREKCALVYLDANRNLEYHLGHSRWTLFGRIIRQLDADFRATAAPTIQERLRASFDEALELLRTDLFQRFAEEFSESFRAQLRRTNHDVTLEFRTFDPLNYYRSVQPLLADEAGSYNPSMAGEGIRNLILLALFRSYARVFRQDAIIAIEEPEIYLHPHAQRSLACLFREVAGNGGQVFMSTHSPSFVSPDRFDELCLVTRPSARGGRPCTRVRQVAADELLAVREQLLEQDLTLDGLRERYHAIANAEHSEAFFATKVLLVEGETEHSMLLVFARSLGLELDGVGISVVNCGGKGNLDPFLQLYQAFGIPAYVMWDNDRGGDADKLRANERLLRAVGAVPEPEPAGRVNALYAIAEGDFDAEVARSADGLQAGRYREIAQQVTVELGSTGKGARARRMAELLVDRVGVPSFAERILRALLAL